MMCNNRNDSGMEAAGFFILGGIMGVMAGAVAGVLFAPEEGSKTRAKIRKHGEKAVKEARKYVDEIEKTHVRPVVKQAQRHVDETTDMVMGEVDRVRGEVEKGVKTVKSKAKSVAKKLGR